MSLLQPSRDQFWMRLALAEARLGLGHVEPNPMVGAVIVKDDRLISLGHHQNFGGPHAEIHALNQAGGLARGATLYVTLEPCCHFGKTPPCVQAVLDAGISRVVAAMPDPFPRVNGGGLALLSQAGVSVDVGLEESAARRLNAPYLKRLFTGRPYVLAKWAMTLDGKAAVASGQSQWISGPESRARVHELRGRVDAILVGIGTVLLDDPSLTVRPPGPRQPTRIVLDSLARLPPSSRLARSALDVPVLLAVSHRAQADRVNALREAGCEILVFETPDTIPILPLLTDLGTRGYTNLLVEGGGRVLGALLDAGEVDEVDVYLAPILEGGDHARTPARGLGCSSMSQALRLIRPRVTTLDGDVRIQGVIPRPWSNPPPAPSDPPSSAT